MSEPPATRQGDPNRQSDWTPRPDPTALTTEALAREVGALKQLIEIRMASHDELMDEKFAGVEKEFKLVERQRVEQKTDAKEALAAALASAKEAVQEQTTTATKNIDTLGERFDTAFGGLQTQLDSLTGRVTVMEAVRLGTQETRSDSSRLVGLALTAFGLFLTLVSVVVLVVSVIS